MFEEVGVGAITVAVGTGVEAAGGVSAGIDRGIV